MADDLKTPRPQGKWRALLIGSVTVNLLVLGVVLGGVIGHDKRPPRAPEIGVGPIGEAFSREDRAALRDAARARGADFRAMRDQENADRAALVAALAAEPFDPAGFDAALAQQSERMRARIEIGNSLLRERILQMDAGQRKAFAERLQKGGRHFGPEGGKDGKPPRD